ncbi:hypothetical protein V5O48_017172, partial [Marasmius crinis-equi]
MPALTEPVIAGWIPHAGKTREHFYKAVEVITICRKLTNSSSLQPRSDKKLQSSIDDLIEKAQQALKSAQLSKSNGTELFDIFHRHVVEHIKKFESTDLTIEFENGWNQAKTTDSQRPKRLALIKQKLANKLRPDSTAVEVMVSEIQKQATTIRIADHQLSTVPDTYIRHIPNVKCWGGDTKEGLLWLLCKIPGGISDIPLSSLRLNAPHFYRGDLPISLRGIAGNDADVSPLQCISNPSSPAERKLRLYLLWDRDPSFYFRHQVDPNPKELYFRNIWRLKLTDDNTADSKFLLK